MSRWWLLPVCLVAWFAQAGPQAEALAVEGVAEFTAAYQSWDAAGFAAAAAKFREATSNPPPSAVHFYWLGAAEFHRLLALENSPGAETNQTAAVAAREAALDALISAVAADAKHAESHALLATLYGMKIGGSPLRAVRFGPRVQKHGKLALESGASNPRVRYLLGTCRFHTAKKAAAWREALTDFLEAERLFLAERQTVPGRLDPRWGYGTCLTFIGRTYERLDQRPQAAEYFRKALVEHPADHLAAEGLERVPNPE